MTTGASTQDTSLYYKPSGRVHPLGLSLAILGSLAIAVPTAIAYGFLVVHIPFEGWLTFLLSAALGAVTGWSTSKLLVLGKVRNPRVALAVVILVMLVGYYVGWAAWLDALFGRGNLDVPLWDVITHPKDLWKAIRSVNKTGWMDLADFVPTGGVLWFLWVVDLLIVFAAAIYSRSAALGRPFCEPCQRWCEGTRVADLEPGSYGMDESLRARLEAKDLDALGELGPVQSGWQFYRVNLHACPQCADLQTLSLDHVTVKINDEGARSEKAKTLVNHLLLSRSEADTVRDLPIRLAAMTGLLDHLMAQMQQPPE